MITDLTQTVARYKGALGRDAMWICTHGIYNAHAQTMIIVPHSESGLSFMPHVNATQALEVLIATQNVTMQNMQFQTGAFVNEKL